MPANVSSPTSPSKLNPIVQNLHDEIAIKAYELYESRGAADGSDVEDWLQAEKEILQQRSQASRSGANG